MAKPEAGPMSGFRDMLGEQMIPRQQMMDTIRGVYQGYGFVPLETPAIERLATLTGKYGNEGDNLMYKFQDHGGRDVALRYDLTVPLARVVAQHRSELPMPYKRYQVGPVWRADSPQAGRYREFYQFDADIVGTNKAIADAEIVSMMSDSMTALGANTTIRVNNRRLLDALVEKSGVTGEANVREFVSTVDKLGKIGPENVLLGIQDIGGKQARNIATAYLGVEGTNQERIHALAEVLGNSEAAHEGISNLESVFSILEGAGYPEDAAFFDQSIARGLNYYTGIIYETYLKDLPSLGSVCSGGRYDGLVKAMGGPDLPAVGTSIGVDRLFEGLRQLGKLEAPKTNTEVLITNYSEVLSGEYMRIAKTLRAKGIPTEVFYDPTIKTGRQIQFADTQGVPFVVFLRPEDVSSGRVRIKNIKTGEQQEVTVDELAGIVRTQ